MIEDKNYQKIHRWLKKEFGSACICENKKCKHKSSTKIHQKYFCWAKLSDKAYEKKRENFIQLCRACHWSYDFKNLEIVL